MKWITLVLLVLAAFVSTALFAQSPTTNMLGPNSPARADTDGDGIVEPTDGAITPTRVGLVDTSIEIPNPWQVGVSGNNTIDLDQPDGSGRFQRFTRTNNEGLVDQLTVTALSPGQTPTAFAMQNSGPGTPSGNGQLFDQNNDGIYDGVTATGAVSFSLNFVRNDSTGDGWADWISIPWSQAQLVGVDFSNPVGGINPQVWVPLADTNGDSRGDSIVADTNGDFQPDADLYRGASGSFGPVFVGASPGVPTLSQWAMLLTLMTLSAIALLQLRRIQKSTVRF